MIISQVFGSKQYDISKILRKEYGELVASNVLKKTGPRTLSIASDDENSLTMAIEACKQLFLNQGMGKTPVPMPFKNLLSITESPSLLFPGNGTQIASELNLSEDISVFDINPKYFPAFITGRASI